MKAKCVIPFVFILLAGCWSAPEFKVGQTIVPAPVDRSPSEQTKQAARFTFDVLSNETLSAVDKVTVATPVARVVSDSVGVPARPLPVSGRVADDAKTGNQSVREVLAKIADLETKLNKVNQFLASNQGKSIEGTGLNLLGWIPSGSTMILLILAVIFFLPRLIALIGSFTPLAGIANFVMPTLKALSTARSTLGHVVSSIEDDITPEMKAKLSSSMDAENKKLIRSIRGDNIRDERR